MSFWITLKGSGTVFSTNNADEAEAKFDEWTKLQEQEVILFACLVGTAVIWKRH